MRNAYAIDALKDWHVTHPHTRFGPESLMEPFPENQVYLAVKGAA